VIPHAELRDVWTDCRHNSRDLMAEDRRRRENRAGGEEQVRVAQPGRSHINQDLTPYRRGNLHILEIEPMADRVNDKRLHVRPPFRTDLAFQCGRESNRGRAFYRP
jgi:hypothetical protein